MVSSILQAHDLPPRQLSSLKQKAKKLGLTPREYIQQLIANDLALDRKAQSSSLDELAAPFRKALKDTSDKELDRMVDAARHRRVSPSSGKLSQAAKR